MDMMAAGKCPCVITELPFLDSGWVQFRLLCEPTESEWVARCLEEPGHEVTVADPNFAPMYATRSKKVKTGKRDARTLCEACRPGGVNGNLHESRLTYDAIHQSQSTMRRRLR